MEGIASKKNIDLAIVEGTFTNTATNSKVLNLPGATYGFCTRLTAQEKDKVFTEAKNFGANRVTKVSQWLPIKDDIYPLYWGKDQNARCENTSAS